MWPYPVLHTQLTFDQQTSSSYISIAQTSLHALGIIITILNMLRPKEPNAADSKAGQGNEAPLNKTQTKLSASTGSGKPSDAAKPSATDKPEKPADGEASESDDNTKPEEPQPDTDAIASLFKQSQALYRRLNTNDQTDFRQNDQQDQTGYADVDINSQQADYSDYDIQGLR
jgi:catalase